MDCCGEFRPPYAPGGWECAPYLPYAPYGPYYPPHDPYRYYRYDYPHHAHHNDHLMPMDYGSYASKEARVRRSLARRDARALTPSHHLPLPHTPPLDCGMSNRGPTYCEPQMWPHYQQMGMGGGWNGSSAMNGGWMSRNPCAREQMRYASDCRPIKAPHIPAHNPVCPPDGRSTSFPIYEDTHYNRENHGRQRNTPEFSVAGPVPTECGRTTRDRFYAEPRRSPPEEKRPPVVPLPAFQQAFGSTEIGKFAEAFSRTEVALEDASNENFSYESFPEWDGPAEPQWSTPPATREIKCEDNY